MENPTAAVDQTNMQIQGQQNAGWQLSDAAVAPAPVPVASSSVAPSASFPSSSDDDMQLDDTDTSASIAGSNSQPDISVEEKRLLSTIGGGGGIVSPASILDSTSIPVAATDATVTTPPAAAAATLTADQNTTNSNVTPTPQTTTPPAAPVDIQAEQAAAEAKARADQEARLAALAEEKRRASRVPVLYRMSCLRCDALLQFPYPSRLVHCAVCTHVNGVTLARAVEHSKVPLPEKSLQEQASHWSTLQVVVFLKSLNLEHLTQIFDTNQVDGAQLLDLTYYDIRDILRIHKPADIEKVLNCINILRGTPVPTPNDLVAQGDAGVASSTSAAAAAATAASAAAVAAVTAAKIVKEEQAGAPGKIETAMPLVVKQEGDAIVAMDTSVNGPTVAVATAVAVPHVAVPVNMPPMAASEASTPSVASSTAPFVNPNGTVGVGSMIGLPIASLGGISVSGMSIAPPMSGVGTPTNLYTMRPPSFDADAASVATVPPPRSPQGSIASMAHFAPNAHPATLTTAHQPIISANMGNINEDNMQQ